MLSVEEYEKRRELREETGGEYSYNIASLLDASSSVDYQEKQSKSDKAWEFAKNVGKSLYNGAVSQTVGDTLQGLLANQYDNYVHAEDTPEEVYDDDADLDSLLAKQMVGRDAVSAIANSEALKPYEIKANNAAEEYAYNAIQGIGQIGGQVAISSIPVFGQVIAPASMYYQILGAEYNELRSQGVDHDTAYKAAEANTRLQFPLEYASFSKLTGRIPANTLAGRKRRMFFEKVITEMGTEGLQQLPEDISKIYATNPDKSAWDIAKIAWERKWELLGNAGYAALVAAPGAALFGGISMRANRQEIDRAISKELHAEGIAHVEESVQHIKETGVNPQYHAAVVNDNTQNQTVYVDGEALAGYAQEKGAEKVAESLGVSVEDIEKAAADGSTVDVKLGNFEATCAAFDGFFQEVKDGTAFEDGGYTPKKEQAEQERIKKEQEKYNAVIDEFKAEEKRIISEWQAAGINKTLAIGQAKVMTSRARALLRTSPEIALEMMRSFHVRRGENGEVQMGYGQFAGENAETADKIKLAEAQKMESEGKSVDEIYKATGWFKGMDNKWRFEIKDNFEGIDFTPLLGDDDHQVTLKEIYKNPKLYKAYPFLRNLKVYPNDFGGDNGKRGRTGTLQDDSPFIELNENLMRNEPERIKETLTHEIQHIIQTVERFAAGGARTTARKLIAEEIQRIAQSEDAGDVEALSSELDSSSSDYDLYRRLGGEQEARETARRAKIQNEIATVEKHIKEARRKGDKAALKRAQFAKALLERQNDGTPSPHQPDAIIVFDGKEIPYSPKQDESLAGNILLAENNEVEIKTPWQDGSIDRAVFDTFLDEGTMEAVRNEVHDQIGLYVNLSDITNIATMCDVREKMPYIMQLDDRFNSRIIRSNEQYKDKAAVKLEYARRCFDNDERIKTRYAGQVVRHEGQDRVPEVGNAVGPESNRNGTDGVIREVNVGLSAQVGTERREAYEHYLKVRDNMIQKKRLPDASAFSTSQTIIPNSDGTNSVVYKANLNRDIVLSQSDRLKEFAKRYGGNFSLADRSAYFTASVNDFEAKKAELLKKGIDEEQAINEARKFADDEAIKRRIGFIGDSDKAFKNIGRSKESGFFDAVKSLMQTNGEIKGKYNPYDNVVTMFKGADASTVIHETWHFFVEQMWNMVESGNASEQTVKDFETLLSYAGMTMDEWANADLDGRRKAHEKLAEAGETYIMEGKSPSYELRRVFRNFAKWLKTIYATIQRSENYAELTDDVREVFDRMLAAEDDIAHMERVNGYFSKLPDVITDNMSDETRAKVEDYIEKAREKAVDILTRRSLVNYTKERRKEIKKFKDEIRPMVEDEVSKRPVYACGYDKKDAARFRELRTQQESVGIWTDENFIDRAFPADTNPVENEVAHLAAVVNTKNWTKGLGEVKKDYQRQADEILQPAIDALEEGMGQGVETIRETNEYGEAKGDIVGRISNNASWYRRFYAENKRRPTKAELREMARDLISGNGYAPEVDDWGWGIHSAEEAEYRKAEGERLADIERHIAACDEIKEKLSEVKKNYAETSAAGSEEFLFRAELTAEQYGYSSADEMMQDIEKSPTKAEAVKQRINERVQELTMQDERNNYEAMIRESLYNEDEALLIGVEQQLIEEYAAKAKERQEANERKAEERAEQRKVNAEVAAARKQQAKNAARDDLSKMNVKEATRTSKFITAERNAAIKSAKLLAQKKFDEALTQKNLQAYWHAMAAESMKIARRQKQYEKFLKKQVGLKREAWLNETHFAAISQLFTRMGIAKPIHKEAAAQSQFENLGAYAAAMEEQFDCVDIAPWILEGSIPISDTNALTLEQYEDVVNAVKNIKAIVKAQKGVDTFNKQATWAETKALMMEKLAELKTIWTPNPNKPTQATAMERFTASMETLDSFLEYLDDATYGWFSQTWGNIIKRASDKEYEYREAYDKADAEALKKWLPDKAAERAANEEVYYDELGNSVTKHTLVKMLINLGNKENSQRLCETVPVGFERSSLWIMPDEFTDRQTAAEQTRQNLIDFLGRVLTKEDVEYAQRKIDAAEMFWGEKNELEKRVKGFGLKKVEATPVVLNITGGLDVLRGEEVVLRGGYFPLMRNGETGSHAASAEVQDDDPLQGRRIRTYHTNTSATKARTQARYPVNLFPGAETQWIYESIHDLCWRETMNDFRRVLNDQELFAMLKSKIGTARMQVFKEMLEVCADPRNSKSFSEGERMLGAAAAWLRQRTSHAAIMLNFKVIAQNYANALLYGNAIDGYTMADNLRALGTYMLKYHTPGSHKEMVDFVFSKSSFMRERCELPDITVRDIVNEKKEFAWEKAAREIGIKAMAMTDNATAIPNWLTAYNKKLNEGATEQEAIDYADTLVRRVLGSSRITDVASIQRGGDIMKLMTMFQSFFNARYNEFLRMERLASKQWTQGQKQKAFANVASYVVSKWLGQTMLAMALALQNPFDVDDEDKWPELIKELKSYSFSMLGPVGQIGNAFAGAIAGMHEYTYRMSAVESTIENVNRSIKRIHSDKATTQDKVEGIVNTATLFVGVPAQLNRIFWNGVDILFNGIDPEIGDIMRRRPKKERK